MNKKEAKIAKDLKKALKEIVEKDTREETFISKYNRVQEIGQDVEVPWDVKHVFPSGTRLEMHGSDISFGEDFTDLEGARKAIEWFATQLGGTLVWKGDDCE